MTQGTWNAQNRRIFSTVHFYASSLAQYGPFNPQEVQLMNIPPHNFLLKHKLTCIALAQTKLRKIIPLFYIFLQRNLHTLKLFDPLFFLSLHVSSDRSSLPKFTHTAT